MVRLEKRRPRLYHFRLRVDDADVIPSIAAAAVCLDSGKHTAAAETSPGG
jgi:hypothetical protein